MNRLKELKQLRNLAESLQLENCQILRKYNMQERVSELAPRRDFRLASNPGRCCSDSRRRMA